IMEGLGRLFDVVTVGNGVWINLEDAAAVTFIGSRAGGDTFTVQEATTAAGTGAQNLVVVDHFYKQTAGAGANQWTKTENDPPTASAVTTDAAVAIEVDSKSLSDGFKYVRCSGPGVTPSSIVVAIVHSLAVQRDPTALPALSS
ncbi:MAG: hypothetical protein ACRDT2_11055, partial [Natronosporangium sp.]